MANISNSYSLINEKELSTNREYYNVKLSQGSAWSVIGQLKSNIQFQLGAEYGQLIGAEVPGADLMKRLGDSTFSAGIFSQKYFQGGGHLQLNLEFRVVEGQYQEGETNLYNMGVSKVTTYAQNLSEMLVPDSGIQDIQGAVSYGFGKVKDIYEGMSKILDTGNHFLGVQEKILSAINERAVIVEVGTFLKCNHMVITNLNVSYSRELTKVGPLYGDFSVSVESIQALSKTPIGGGGNGYAVGNVLRSGQNVNRVKFISNSEQNNTKES